MYLSVSDKCAENAYVLLDRLSAGRGDREVTSVLIDASNLRSRSSSMMDGCDSLLTSSKPSRQINA